MSSVVIAGDTSGTITLAAPAVSGTTVLTLPTTSGTVIVGTGGVTGVASGGTGRTTNTAYAVICGGTTTGGAEQSIASVGTSGQVLTSNGAGALPTFQAAAGFPTGTAMMFVQTAAPTGWTKSTTHDNKALRVVSGAASSGGSVAFTTAFASQAVSGSNASVSVTGTTDATTLSTPQIPSHTHTIQGQRNSGAPAQVLLQGAANPASVTSDATGGGGSHTHGFTSSTHTHTFTGTAINLAVQYVDVIIATKD